MSYLLHELRSQTGRPIYLYEFDVNGTITRYTAANKKHTFGGNEYTPASIQDSVIKQSTDLSKDSLTLVIPFNDPLAQNYLGITPDTRTKVTILRGHLSDVDNEFQTIWKGRVIATSAKDKKITLKCESVFTSLNRHGLRAHYQRMCRHTLYRTGCNVSLINKEVAGSVIAISGLDLTVNSAGNFADGYFNGGMAQFADDSYRVIKSHTGTTVTIDRESIFLLNQFNDFPSANISMFPGCNRATTDCKDKFNNIVNFGGFPYIPGRNPFDGNSII
jgi:uncharacterized phage protein (TIGR02218 family)